MRVILERLLANRHLALFHDSMMVPVAWLMAFWLRYNLTSIPEKSWMVALDMLPLVLAAQMLVALWVGIYRGIWRFASIPDLLRIVKAVLMGTALSLGAVFLASRLVNIPRAVFPLYAILLTALWGGPRFLYRILKDYVHDYAKRQRVLVVGAGDAGESLVRELLRDKEKRYHPVAFLDDRKKHQGKDIHGLRVLGGIQDIQAVCHTHRIDMVMLAIPSATAQEMQRIVQACDAIQMPYCTLPGISDLVEDRVTINALRRVEIEDLLGREPVALDWGNIAGAIQGKKILVTGGGGSIGAELCRQIANQHPKEMIIIDHSEFHLYQITQSLQSGEYDFALHALLIDVSDQKLLARALQQYRPQVIFHAAAYKHVPMLEYQISAAVKNNILGTKILADLACQLNVENFVLVSSDKAVNPTNIMGLTKRIAEIYCQNLNRECHTRFITVRFGNVLGSTGSVVPLFRQQLEQGGPLTVTHPEMTRYFMTIPEATRLILQAYAMGEGGEIFVLDMGEPVKIQYLAEQMIRLAGKVPNQDIQIAFTGVRPGEKLFEELFHKSELLQPTAHEKISLAKSRQMTWDALQEYFTELESAYYRLDRRRLLQLMQALVPEYKGLMEQQLDLSLGVKT